MNFMALKRENMRKRSILVIDSFLKDSAFAAVERYVKGVPFVNRKHTKRVPFS